jgi:hypothetical protein
MHRLSSILSPQRRSPDRTDSRRSGLPLVLVTLPRSGHCLAPFVGSQWVESGFVEDSAAASVVHLEQPVSREDCRITSQVCKVASQGDVVGFDSVWLTAAYQLATVGIGISIPEGL